MITCNRCGNMSPAGAVNCQTCGEPLSSKVETGFGPSRMGAPQEQPGLPAWLESLRAGERPAAPANNNPPNFSTADLIDEGALPSWMRSGRPDGNDAAASSPHLALRSSSAPGPNTDDSKGINAKSLIDEGSLPSWMHENRQATGPIPQGGIAASSLVQPDFVPDWMKSLQSPQSPASNNPAMPSMPPMSPGSPQSPAPYAQYRQPGQPARPGEFAPQAPQGFSAGDLIDQQSLPSWMSQQEEKKPATASSGPVPQGGLSPSSLLDMDALPSWMREGGQQEQRGGEFPPAQPNQGWQSAPSPMQQTPSAQNPAVWQATPQTPAMQNAPGWQPASQQPMPQQQSPGNPRAGYGVPPRVESMRVPSRPRGEINPNESNEAAANVFASMLGVASAAPNFPVPPVGQPYGMQGPPSGSSSPGQMPAPTQGFGGLQETQPPQGYAPGGYSSGVYQMGNPGQQGNYQTGNLGQQGNYQTGNLGQQGNYPMGNPGQQGNYQTGNLGQQGNYQTGNLGQQGNYQMGNPPSGVNQYAMPANGVGANQRSAPKPAKKGFFETIRDWFR